MRLGAVAYLSKALDPSASLQAVTPARGSSKWRRVNTSRTGRLSMGWRDQAERHLPGGMALV